MISSIVVGIDGSDAAGRALEMACSFAKQFGAALHICHTPREETVTYAAEAISGFYVGPNPAEHELLREAAQKIVEAGHAYAVEQEITNTSTHIGHGDPARDLLERAEAVHADLIVTGRRGLGDLGGLVLGSISHQVSKHASCACLTVP